MLILYIALGIVLYMGVGFLNVYAAIRYTDMPTDPGYLQLAFLGWPLLVWLTLPSALVKIPYRHLCGRFELKGKGLMDFVVRKAKA